MPTPILATKLYIPPPRVQAVSRPRLIHRLNDALSSKLTLISAPAGYGKTTLVSEWIPSIGAAVAWLSLDEADKENRRFFSYLLAAVQSIKPEIGANIQAELQPPQSPPVESMLTKLLNDITQFEQPLFLVLDDYHLLDSKEIDDLLTFVLDHIPPNLHLIITTRSDPIRLPLPRLRARKQLTEIHAEDLRFTLTETSEFLKQMMGLKLSETEISALEIRTEGWAAGLQLAALSMQGKKDLPSFVKSFTGSHRFVLDYLLNEVLLTQTKEVHDFLISSAILERFNGPLCDAVLQNAAHSSQKILESIEQANLFLIPLDEERKWYRYHHLFAEVLHERLRKEKPSEIFHLHLRASKWFHEKEQYSEAINHALAAKDFDRAADLLEFIWLKEDRFTYSAPWLAWVRILPEKLVNTRPVLMRNYAQALFFLGRFEEGEKWLNQVETLIGFSVKEFSIEAYKTHELPAGLTISDKEQYQELPAAIAFSRGYQAVVSGKMVDVIQYSELLLKLVPENDYARRSEAFGMKTFSNYVMGNLDAAYDTFDGNIAGMLNYGLVAESLIANFILADIRTIQGRLREVLELYERPLRSVTKEITFQPGMSFLYSGLSNLYYSWGDYDIATEYLNKSIELDKQAPMQLCQYRIALAQANKKQSIGDLDGCLKELDKAEQLYYRNVVPESQSVAAIKAQVWCQTGKLNDALEWVKKQKLSVDDELSFIREFDHITLARVLLTQYHKEAKKSILHQTHKFLDRLHEAAKVGNRNSRLIEVLIIQSLAYQAEHDSNKALDKLLQALILGEPESYIKIFVDEGKRLELLIKELDVKQALPDYTKKLLLAFAHANNHTNTNTSTSERTNTKDGSTTIHNHTPKPTKSSSLNDALVEPLSTRELEVLKLIAQGLSNQEISETLFIAITSVKGHNQRIFAKLKVQRRTEAVARARELALV